MEERRTGNPFSFSLAEFSGSLADLGVMLPLILALISLNGMDAASVFFGVGIAYVLTALVYRLPIPVQPLKSVSAVALGLGLAPVVIVAGAIWNSIAFLAMGAAGLDRWVRVAFPKPVVRGIQLGLAWLLYKSAWSLVTKVPAGWQGGFALSSSQTVAWLWALVGGAAMFLLMFSVLRRDFAALGVFIFGVGISMFHLGLPAMSWHLTLPRAAVLGLDLVVR